MGVRRCEFCDRVYVQWLRCRDGTRRLFEATPVEVADVPDGSTGWVPGRVTVNGYPRVVMSPLGHVGRAKAAAARRVVLQHRCPKFQELYDRAMR